MLHMVLVFAHLLATSMALGAIVATDLRMLSKFADERVRIAPPNPFVARLVTMALLLLYVTGAALLWSASREQPDFLTPKVQGKLVLVALLTLNAVVLHRFTFPRLARGRSLARWGAVDWLVVVPPVALSNCLWMFCAFLGTARAWNHAISVGQLLGIAAALYAVALAVVVLVLATAARPASAASPHSPTIRVKRSLATIGRLGQAAAPPAATRAGAQGRIEPMLRGRS